MTTTQPAPGRAGTAFTLAFFAVAGLACVMAWPMHSMPWPDLPPGAPAWRLLAALKNMALQAFQEHPAQVIVSWLASFSLAAAVFLLLRRSGLGTLPGIAAGLVAGFNPAVLSLLLAPGSIAAEGAQPRLLGLLALVLAPGSYAAADWNAVPAPGLYLGTVSLGMAMLGMAGAGQSARAGRLLFGLGLALGAGVLTCEPAMPALAAGVTVRLALAVSQVGAGTLNALVLTRLFQSRFFVRPAARCAIMAVYAWFLLVDFGQAVP